MSNGQSIETDDLQVNVVADAAAAEETADQEEKEKGDGKVSSDNSKQGNIGNIGRIFEEEKTLCACCCSISSSNSSD